MSQPPGYTQSIDFSQEEANGVAGRSTVRTPALDAELSAIEATLDAILFNLALIQRDDTNLADRVVKLYSLADDVRAAMAAAGSNPRGPWVTATAYAVKDMVSQGTGTYICITAHTSGVFATDLAAGKWLVIFDSAAYSAVNMTFTPTGTIASVNVQAALAEVATESVQNAIGTTKGDIISFTGNATPARKAAGADGYALRPSSGNTDGLAWAPSGLGYTLDGGYLDYSVAANALTIAVKTWLGNNPSDAEPVFVTFRSSTDATGLPVIRKINAATSLTVSSGSTLLTLNSVAFRLWVVGFDDAGTFRLGVINCLSTAPGVGTGRDLGAIFPLRGWGIASSTAEGGGGGADSAQTFYTGVAVAAKAYATLGWASWEAGLAAAGTWSAAPTRAHPWGLRDALPGDIVQQTRQDDGTGAPSTGVTTIPDDDTIPQITEGDQYIAKGLTPSSAANLIAVEAQGSFANDAAGATALIAAMFRDSTGNALATLRLTQPAANASLWFSLKKTVLAATTSLTVFRLRAGGGSAGTTTFNGISGGRKMGGAGNSFVECREIMA